MITKKIRQTLTDEERIVVNKHLFQNCFPFWRVMRMFFHSGYRKTEFMNVRKLDVDLTKRRFKVLVKRGKVNYYEDWRPIKGIALEHWQTLYNMAERDDYLFSAGLVLGKRRIRENQLTKRWYRYVKKELVKVKKKYVFVDCIFIYEGKEIIITSDSYALKHLNTTETIDFLSRDILEAAAEAAKMNGHTDDKMVNKVNDVKRLERKEKKQAKIISLKKNLSDTPFSHKLHT